MPIHDWTRVPDAVCQTSHLEWCIRLKARLNDELLPPEYYALMEPSAREPVDGFTGPTIGEQLQNVDEVEPIIIGDHSVGMWEAVGWNFVVIRTADEDKVIHTVRLPLRPVPPVGDMPVFLRPGACVMLPMEQTYTAAYQDVPRRGRRLIEAQ